MANETITISPIWADRIPATSAAAAAIELTTTLVALARTILANVSKPRSNPATAPAGVTATKKDKRCPQRLINARLRDHGSAGPDHDARTGK